MKTWTTAACLALLPLAAAAQDAERGADLYWTYCASCHGDDGEGGGPMTEVLRVQPPDLTELQAGNDGVFPVARVAYRIDGRDPLLAHGGPMPIFGDLFEGAMTPLKTETGQPVLAGAGIADLVAYLRTIQD